MFDLKSRLKLLKRPSLLSRAARSGVKDYVPERHLRQVLPLGSSLPAPQRLIQLLEVEADYNALRTAGAADYQCRRHVMILIALLGEARAYLAPTA